MELRALAIATLSIILASCGGGGGGSSSSQPETSKGGSEKEQSGNFCPETNQLIALKHGDSCQLSENQKSRINISLSTDTLSCDQGVISLGSFRLSSLNNDNLTITCAKTAEKIAEDQAKANALVAHDQLILDTDNTPFDLYLDFESMGIQGTNASITDNGKTFAQIHKDGDLKPEFQFEIDNSLFIDEDSNAAMLIVFSPENHSTADYLNGTRGFNSDLYFDIKTVKAALKGLNDRVKISCEYSGTLNDLKCAGVTRNLSSRFTEIPAKVRVHALACTVNEGRAVCKNGVSALAQFN